MLRAVGGSTKGWSLHLLGIRTLTSFLRKPLTDTGCRYWTAIIVGNNPRALISNQSQHVEVPYLEPNVHQMALFSSIYAGMAPKEVIG